MIVVEQSNPGAIATFATLIVALIAGTFSLIGLVIAKEQKVSEFRQTWIDALRCDVAEFIAQANIIHAALVKLSQQAGPDKVVSLADKVAFLAVNRENYLAINRASSKIRLRLSPGEKLSISLISSMRKLEALLVSEMSTLPGSDKELAKLNLEIEENAHNVLRKEWLIVKRGERQYVVAKWFAAILFATCLILIGFVIVSAFPHIAFHLPQVPWKSRPAN
jgi:hypothetical protein